MNKTRRRFSFLPSKGHIGLILLLSYLIFFRSCQQYNLFINEVARSSQKNICACAPISKLKKLSEHHDFKKGSLKTQLNSNMQYEKQIQCMGFLGWNDTESCCPRNSGLALQSIWEMKNIYANWAVHRRATTFTCKNSQI